MATARRKRQVRREKAATKEFQKVLISQAVGYIDRKVDAMVGQVNINTTAIAKVEAEAVLDRGTHTILLGKLDALHAKVDEIALVKLNGGPPVKLSEALRQLYEQTEGVRANAKLGTAWQRWQKQNPIGRAVSSPIGKFIGAGIFIYAALAVLYSFGFAWAEPKALILKLVGLLPF